MTRGSKIEPLNHGNGKLSFKEFYQTNANVICASIGIPPNVAFSIYNDSFSASRTATKDWEHTISFERDDVTNQFYAPIYAFFLHIQIIEGLVNLPGYLAAHKNDNYLVLEAYRNSRFTGPMFPHIDPLKEVKAERAKLGKLAVNMPLTTLEKSTETLYGGDSRANMEQFGREMQEAIDNGIEEEQVIVEDE
jgi:capsid protein